MGIIATPELWTDGFSATPPFQWEALEEDDRYYFDNTIGSVTTQGGVTYTGDDPYPDTLIFEWELLVPPTHGNILFFWNTDGVAPIEECEFEVLDLSAGVGAAGSVTLTPDESWGDLYWGIYPQEVTVTPYTYASIVAVGDGAVEEESEGKFYRVTYLPVEDFINLCNSRQPDDDNVEITLYGPDDIQLMVYTDRSPTYWTSVNDDYIIFDSYDSTVESTILANNTEVFVDKDPGFSLEDYHVINLPANLVPYLEAQVESYCMATLKQQPNPKSEQKERKLRVRQQRNKWRHQRIVKDGPDFGR